MSREFREDLTRLLNKHSMEARSNTPDYILAKFIMGSLMAFDGATLARTDHYKTTAPRDCPECDYSLEDHPEHRGGKNLTDGCERTRDELRG